MDITTTQSLNCFFLYTPDPGLELGLQQKSKLL